jgi:hypothetical protein
MDSAKPHLKKYKINMMRSFLIIIGLCFFIPTLFAQQGEPPELLYREDWNELPPYDLMTPYSLTQKDVMNPDLIQNLYGPGQDSLRKRHHGSPEDPYYVFTGFCPSNWALSFSNNKTFADLRGDAVVRCRIRNSGFRNLHLIIQMASGNWFISDAAASPSSVWQVYDFVIKDIKWSLLDIKTITPVAVVENPELHYGANWLSQIDKIGFSDLMNGGLSNACSRIDWIEVYANPSRK